MPTTNGSIQDEKQPYSRRDFLKRIGFATTSLTLSQSLPYHLSAAERRRNAPVLYNEKYRPQFHFTPQKNWTNDPNGLAYYKGEYHLFFQHNPFGIKWGNMTWGHAISTDLVGWKQLPNAIEPDELGSRGLEQHIGLPNGQRKSAGRLLHLSRQTRPGRKTIYSEHRIQ